MSSMLPFIPSKLKICSFSLCSNVTGILTDPDVVNVLAHKYNGIFIKKISGSRTSSHLLGLCLCLWSSPHLYEFYLFEP